MGTPLGSQGNPPRTFGERSVYLCRRSGASLESPPPASRVSPPCSASGRCPRKGFREVPRHGAPLFLTLFCDQKKWGTVLGHHPFSITGHHHKITGHHLKTLGTVSFDTLLRLKSRGTMTGHHPKNTGHHLKTPGTISFDTLLRSKSRGTTTTNHQAPP